MGTASHTAWYGECFFPLFGEGIYTFVWSCTWYLVVSNKLRPSLALSHPDVSFVFSWRGSKAPPRHLKILATWALFKAVFKFYDTWTMLWALHATWRCRFEAMRTLRRNKEVTQDKSRSEGVLQPTSWPSRSPSCWNSLTYFCYLHRSCQFSLFLFDQHRAWRASASCRHF